jgi:hypothetical protein
MIAYDVDEYCYIQYRDHPAEIFEWTWIICVRPTDDPNHLFYVPLSWKVDTNRLDDPYFPFYIDEYNVISYKSSGENYDDWSFEPGNYAPGAPPTLNEAYLATLQISN